MAEHGSPEIARRLVERLQQRCRRIGKLPYGGTARDEMRKGLRSVPFEKAATIYYSVSEHEVTIAAVLSRGRDTAGYFR